MRHKILSALLLLMSVCAYAGRERQTINDSWEFRRGDSDSWQRVTLPHTYNLDAYLGRSYYQERGD